MKYPKRLIVSCGVTLLIASMVLGHRADDWSKFDHHSFRVVGVPDGNSLSIETANGKQETVTLCGVDAVEPAKTWLSERALGRDVILMLDSPQTRDSSGHLLTFVFLDNDDLNVELVKAGLAYADRREKTVMDGLIDPAEAAARKKKLGIWYGMTDEQMPAWRKAWLRSLPGKSR